MNAPPGARAPLSSLLEAVDVLARSGAGDPLVSGITHDSRRAGPGTLFVAYQGVNLDVHRFLPDALARGAVAALVEREPRELIEEFGLAPDICLIQVPRARRARALIAAALHGDPSREMLVVGVTGTDGKTTTSSLLHAMLTAAGRRAGLISTVSARVGQQDLDTGLHVTTPEAEDVQAILAMMRDAGAEIAVLETTSHGLDQDRVTGVAFDVAVLTNITPESLEYHGSFEAYRAAKARLFQMVSAAEPKASVDPDFKACFVLNADDPSSEILAEIPVARCLRYALDAPAAFEAEAIEATHEGLRFQLLTPAGSATIRSGLRGRYNVANILAASAAASALGCSLGAIADGAASLPGVPGRMERIDEGQPFEAIVDFAHTPNALQEALGAARALRAPGGRLITVFGCAGLRDPGKRAPMGRIAGRLADWTVITAEDPRSEDLDAILDAIAEGLEDAGAVAMEHPGEAGDPRTGYRRLPDRAAAIAAACRAARVGDVVIVCGKGHEQSMCFGDVEHPWDDRAALRATLRGEAYLKLPTHRLLEDGS